MCTLAWGPARDGFWACFNRDEQRARALAEEPAIHEAGNHKLIYARDPAGGGTWCAASTAGFAVALLNHYPGEDQPARDYERSRGQLVLQLAAAGGPDNAATCLGDTDLSAYAPFYLFIIGREAVRAHAWDGDRLTFPQIDEPFWTTSSYKPDAVATWRRGWWDTVAPARAVDRSSTAELLRTLQADQPAYGTTMDRDRARTQSQIELTFEKGRCSFLYRAREPEGPGFEEPVHLQLPLTAS